MTTSTIVFLGIEALSLGALCAVLAEHRRLSRGRDELMSRLALSPTRGRIKVRSFLVILYVVVMLLFTLLSFYLYFRT
jgi:hypothetical protein